MGLGSSELSWTVLVPEGIPQAKHPRWAVVGRSNTGKSSLLNAMTHPRKLFRTGSKPGVTIGLIAVKVKVAKPKHATLELVDLPGWGYAKRSAEERKFWNPLAETLRETSQNGLLWIFLVDPLRKPLPEEWAFLDWIGNSPYFFVFTKSDRIHSSKRAEIEAKWAEPINAATEGPLWISSQDGEGLPELFKSAREFTRMHTS